MLDDVSTMTLEPIGVVHSRILERREMPAHGVRAEIEVFPRYQDGLLLIEENTHLWIVGWFSEAERAKLQIVRPEYRSGHRRRGVFGLRSTTRPNSIAMAAVRLLERRQGILVVDGLDFLDGTLVLDIKRYSPSWDTIFAARSSRERYLEVAEAADLDLLETEAVKFHGELTPAIVAAARLMQYVIERWQILPRDDALLLSVSTDERQRELADALQGMTAATIGSGRLALHHDDQVSFTRTDRRLTARLNRPLNLSVADTRRAPLGDLFSIEE